VYFEKEGQVLPPGYVDEECLRRSLLPKVNPLVEAQKAREAAAKKKAEEMMRRKGGSCSDSRGGAGRVFTARRTTKVRRLTMLSNAVSETDEALSARKISTRTCLLWATGRVRRPALSSLAMRRFVYVVVCVLGLPTVRGGASRGSRLALSALS
jgi:hypothetical protein